MSTLDPDNEPTGAAGAPGHDNDALGPSDSSDTGSDVAGTRRPARDFADPLLEAAAEEDESTDTDREGTGDRASVEGEEEGTKAEEFEELNLEDEDEPPEFREDKPSSI
jgi:hypothetical protein